MQILLDTHIYLWWLKDDNQLTKKARSLIISADTVYISSVSIWEAAIKIQLKKLRANINDLLSAIDSEGFLELPLTAKHAAKILELRNHHKDPFDRALIAQSISEPLHFLTADDTLKRYSELIEIV